MKIFKRVFVIAVILIGLAVLLDRTADFFFREKVFDEIGQLYDKAAKGSGEKVTEKDLDGLPKIVAAHLRAAGVVGKPRIKLAVFKETGTIRTDPGSSWMHFTADQVFTGNTPGFVWYANCGMGPVNVCVRDIYSNGRGNMLVKAFSFFNIADAFGPETDISALGRYLGELELVPTAFLDKNIKWEEKDKYTVKATLKDIQPIPLYSSKADLTAATAYFRYNDKFECESFVADRYAYEGGRNVKRAFVGKCCGKMAVDGITIPKELSGSWVRPDGMFEYVKITIESGRFQ